MTAIAPAYDEPFEETAPTSEPVAGNKTFGDEAEEGYLLKEKDKGKVARFLREMWESQEPRYNRTLIEGEVNERRRGGDTNVWAVKSQDVNRWQVYVPHGALQAPVAVLNKPNRLCYRFISQLYSDPAIPEADPPSGEDDDRDAADLATRVLEDLGSEAGLNDLKAHKMAQDYACSWGSGWIWYFTDPRGGGRKPIEILAHPMAQHVDQALIDPVTGAEAQKSDLRLRYITDQGLFTENSSEAALRWMPKVVRQTTHAGAVRLWPPNAEDIWDAEGLIYSAYESWATVKQWYPDLVDTPKEQRDEAIKYRPKDTKHLLPKKMGKPHDPTPKEGHEDDGLVFVQCAWFVEGSVYPDGAYVVAVGKDLLPIQEPWIGEVDGRREKRDIPWTQVKQYRGGPDRPAGEGLMHFFGPAGEFRAELYGRISDHLEKMLNRKVFVPTHSTYQAQAAQFAFATHIPIPPGGEPKYEDVPTLPRELPELLDRIDDEIKDASSLQETGQGLEAKGVNSGRQALAIVSQVQAGLRDVLDAANTAMVRGWRIQLQCVKYDYDVPQEIRWVGEDGRHKVERFMGSDLGSTRDVSIKRGTGTTMNPIQKAQMLSEFGQIAGLPPEEVQDLISSGLNQTTGLQDDPHRLRVRRQIHTWEAGPPEGWVPPMAPVDPMTGGPLLQPDPMTGMMVPVPPPPDPVLMKIWTQNPADVLPIVATMRIREIARAMARVKYESFPPEWQLGINQELARLQAAMMPPAPPPPPGGGSGDLGQPNPELEIANTPESTPTLQRGEAAVLGA